MGVSSWCYCLVFIFIFVVIISLIQCYLCSRVLVTFASVTACLAIYCVQAAATREHCEDKIHIISDKLREAEARAEFAERSVQKLQKEVDKLEDDLLAEKEKNKVLADEMEATLHDIQNM